MYFKFQIKPVANRAEKEGEYIVRFTGQSEFINVNDVLGSDVMMKGKDRIQKFKTGLETSAVASNGLIPIAEKENFKKQIESYRPILEEYFGADQLDPTNTHFWKDPEIGRLKVSNIDLDKFYDTANPKHAVLYFNIMGGGYIDTVAPSREFAERFRIGYYMETEAEHTSEDADSYMTKAQAFTLLNELAFSADAQSLLFLSWVLHSDSKGFGAYNSSTPKSELFRTHGEFIEGKLSFTKRRNAPTKFIEAANSWKDTKIGRPRIMTEAYLKAAQVYSYVNSDREGKLSLPSGLQLGLSMDTAIDTLLKPRNNKEYEELRDFVEKKWSS